MSKDILAFYKRKKTTKFQYSKGCEIVHGHIKKEGVYALQKLPQTVAIFKLTASSFC